MIHVAPGRAAFNTNDSAVAVDAYGAPLAHVDHEAAIAEGSARDVVTATSDRQRQAVLARKIHAGDHIRTSAHARDQRWPPRDHCVPDGACLIESRLGSLQQRPTQQLAKFWN